MEPASECRSTTCSPPTTGGGCWPGVGQPRRPPDWSLHPASGREAIHRLEPSAQRGSAAVDKDHVRRPRSALGPLRLSFLTPRGAPLSVWMALLRFWGILFGRQQFAVQSNLEPAEDRLGSASGHDRQGRMFVTAGTRKKPATPATRSWRYQSSGLLSPQPPHRPGVAKQGRPQAPWAGHWQRVAPGCRPPQDQKLAYRQALVSQCSLALCDALVECGSGVLAVSHAGAASARGSTVAVDGLGVGCGIAIGERLAQRTGHAGQ